ncbi:aspartate aminotransferase family protein [Actinokineospora sp. NBRC 105648]|uniref:aminotransferase family protein n=1 Tax=Actinokineospora sp. NBRC 105648 TaxID=3032206 RepID=UPI0024A2965F|nr:aspartate aminotransferase family protein [Actinokineospora sp. NBRC 105648]GLZ38119.1 adenosylmethionine-8-amino-7-oxononanoate aminotransferase [Actinokineospora sp. NBRC 105648]
MRDTADPLTSTARASAARARDRAHVWHTWSPIDADRTELMVVRGEGHRVWDVDGREYLDAGSLNSTCGYRHPEVVAALTAQLDRLHHFDLATATHDRAGLLAERLAGHLPAGMAKTLFVNSGSEGVEAAMIMAACWSSYRGENRTRVVSLARGYQGATMVSRSLSALPRNQNPLSPPLPVTMVDLPCATEDVRRPAALAPLLAAFDRAVNDHPDGPPLAVVVEPFLNVGGGVVLPEGFLRGVRELCDASGALLVLDEVFTAYGRSGRMFACVREDVAPDILVSGKGLGGGYVPIGAVSARARVHDEFRNDPVVGGLRYGHTTSGHALGVTAALACLDVLEKDRLVERADELGGRMLRRLAALSDLDGVLDVRGLGLILVVQTPSAEHAAAVLARGRRAGVLLRQQGDAVMVVPPLTVDDEAATEITDATLSLIRAELA